jgi:hypothetical protein
MQGRFIATTAAAVLAALAVGPGAALATPGSLVDDSPADFAAGTVPGTAWIVEPGTVALRHTTVADNFDGTTLGPPVGLPWAATLWDPAGSASVSGGSVTVNGARVSDAHVNGSDFYDPGKVLEFRATFTEPFENVGLGDTFGDDGPWAMFSTGGGSLPFGLYARTRDVDTGTGTRVFHDTLLTDSPTVPHVYRIEWTTSDVRFFVDGELRPTPPITIAKMRPVISDLTKDDASVKVDWLGMSIIPLATGGEFTSRVLDAGTATGLTWGTLGATSTAAVPAIQTRTGNTPTPDSSWSSFQLLGVGGAIQSPSGRRYIQYTAALTGSAWSLDRVFINYDVLTPSQGGGSNGGSVSGGSGIGTQGGGNSSASADKTKPKVTLIAATLRATKKGAVGFTYGCPSSETSCTITLKLKSGKKTVASKTFTVKGGKSKAVTLVLSKDARKLLAKRGSLKVSTVVNATDAAGNARTTTKAMTIRRATH